MNRLKSLNARMLSVAGFSVLFAYILSFPFEGQVLYSLLELREIKASAYILAAIVAHFAGLFSCGYFVKSQTVAKYAMLTGMGACLISTMPFFFAPTALWAGGLIVSGYASGCAVAAWSYFLKAFTPKNERIKSCADVLIYSNIIMIVVNVVAVNVSPFIGLTLSMFCLMIGMAFIWALPTDTKKDILKKTKTNVGIQIPLMMLCLFVFIITINSGLMYQVINPAYEHLTGLVSWYWAVPYIVTLAIMRNLPMQAKRSTILYVGMVMIMGAFICFMLLGRNASDYFVVDTLMLGACGIFDLFWWSILGEMPDCTDDSASAKVFGIGLSANVFGVLCGGVLGMAVTSIQLPDAEVAVIALTVVCFTLVMLPPLNRQLVMLLKNHAYLAAYDGMNENQQTALLHRIKTLDPLTAREQEVFKLILSGKSNREIAQTLFISESTVKTHIRNIFSKYDVRSRTELISNLLKNQFDA